MGKVLLVFASLTGNTEDMADAIAIGVRAEGLEVELKSVMDANASEMEAYDGVLLGAYTWGDGELPDEFLDFYDEMDDLTLDGKPAAVFGSCDSSYPEFGAAVDTLEQKLTESGALLVQDGLKIELSPSKDEVEVCKQFGTSFAKQLLARG